MECFLSKDGYVQARVLPSPRPKPVNSMAAQTKDETGHEAGEVVLEGLVVYTDPFLAQVAQEVRKALEKGLRPHIGRSAASGVGRSYFRWIVLRGFPDHFCDVDDVNWRSLPAYDSFVLVNGGEGAPILWEDSLANVIHKITRPFYERCASRGLAGRPRIYNTNEATLPPLKLHVLRETQLFAQEFEDALRTELPKEAPKWGLYAEMVAKHLPTICKLSKLFVFELPDFLDDPEQFTKQAMAVVCGCSIEAPEMQELDLVMDLVRDCSALQRFFGDPHIRARICYDSDY